MSDQFAILNRSGLPTSNTGAISSTSYLYYTSNRVASSPSSGVQEGIQSRVNLTQTLALPDPTKSVDRVLLNDKIYYRNGTDKQKWAYVGNDVLFYALGNDGTTNLYSSTYDYWSAPVSLSGNIGDFTLGKSYIGFLTINSTKYYDFTQPWASGASYSLRKAYRTDDTIFVWDSGSITYADQPTPIATTATTVPAYFNLVGSYTVDRVSYAFGDGTVVKYGSTDVWVANEARAPSVSPTQEFAVLFALNGKVYRGKLQKKRTRIQREDAVDTTKILESELRLNVKAAESLRAAVKF